MGGCKRINMKVYKNILGLGDVIITFPCMVLGFIFEAGRLAFKVGQDRYVNYLGWLIQKEYKHE